VLSQVLLHISENRDKIEYIIVEKNNQTYYYHADGLGSIIAISGQTGALVQTYDYDSFGNPKTTTQTVTQPYTYTAREYDPETGLYFYRARQYDARTGRFLQKDPIGFKAGDVNLFRYGGNSPTNATDPMGLESGVATMPWNWGVGGARTGAGALGGAACGTAGAAAIFVLGVPSATSSCADYPPKDECKPKCPPCKPYPVGTIGYRGPDYSTHYPCGNPHMNLLRVYQDPVSCKCYWRKNDPDCVNGNCPSPQWVNCNGGCPPVN